MKKWLVLVIPAVTLGFAACSSSTTGSDADAGTEAGPGPSATGTGTSTTAPSNTADTSVPLPAPATFNLTSGTCAETAPCGGTLEGTWDYSGGCISDADLSAFEAQVRRACATATVGGVTGTMSGRVTFAGNNVTRRGTVAVTTDLTIPPACAQQPPVSGDCNSVALLITQASQGQVKKATCTAAGAGCNCKVDLAFASDKIGATFTTSGNKLITSDGDEYDYCVAGTKLTHKQTKAGTPTTNEPGSFEATKR